MYMRTVAFVYTTYSCDVLYLMHTMQSWNASRYVFEMVLMLLFDWICSPKHSTLYISNCCRHMLYIRASNMWVTVSVYILGESIFAINFFFRTKRQTKEWNTFFFRFSNKLTRIQIGFSCVHIVRFSVRMKLSSF